jgi:DNA-binding transcriptional MerR regulator
MTHREKDGLADTVLADTEPRYGIGVLARRLGVAPATLRDWELRYGIGPSGRSPGGHRRYLASDIARIESLRRLVLRGMPPAEAARAALAAQPQPESDPSQPKPAAERALPGASGDGPATGTGGRSIPLPGQLPEARGLARAALALDNAAIAARTNASLSARGAVRTWELIAVPVLMALGKRVAAAGRDIEVEHVLSGELMAALAVWTAQFDLPRDSRPVLLACADGEMHSLPLYALQAALAERNVRTTLLGALTPPEALASAISRIGPAAVFVWSQMATTGDPGQLAGLPRHRPPFSLLIGGLGWQGLPEGARRLTSLAEAVQASAAATGVG